MKRYVIEEDRAIWVREVCEVEAESEEEARDTFDQGDYEYLGCSLGDSIAFLDSSHVSCEQTDATPHMTHSAHKPDENPVIEAARTLLNNLIDADEYGPKLVTDDEFPRDEDGDPWHTDCWELYQALNAYDAEPANQ
ncbi:MAG: hypothetical protein ABIP48_18085 [Planctomycetota bacterium]